MNRLVAYGRIVTLALVATLFVALAPGTATACSCMPVTTQDMVAEARIVFVGEEIARTDVGGQQAWGSVAVTFQVTEAYKGQVSEQMTVITGESSAGCGVGPTSGLVGITVHGGAEAATISLCGSLHEAGAVAALLDPIDIISTAPEPLSTEPASSGLGGIVLAAGIALIVAGIGVAAIRRRRDDWQDGWSSEG